MRFISILFMFCSSIALCEGPLFLHKDSTTQQEFENVYQDLRSKKALTTKIGTIVRVLTASSGDVSYAGIGFRPTSLVFLAGNGASFSVGLDNATNHGNIYSVSPSYTDSGNTSIGIVDGSLNGQTGFVKSLDEDGFTISWTKTGTPSGFNIDVYYLALK